MAPKPLPATLGVRVSPHALELSREGRPLGSLSARELLRSLIHQRGGASESLRALAEESEEGTCTLELLLEASGGAAAAADPARRQWTEGSHVGRVLQIRAAVRGRPTPSPDPAGYIFLGLASDVAARRAGPVAVFCQPVPDADGVDVICFRGQCFRLRVLDACSPRALRDPYAAKAALQVLEELGGDGAEHRARLERQSRSAHEAELRRSVARLQERLAERQLVCDGLEVELLSQADSADAHPFSEQFLGGGVLAEALACLRRRSAGEMEALELSLSVCEALKGLVAQESGGPHRKKGRARGKRGGHSVRSAVLAKSGDQAATVSVVQSGGGPECASPPTAPNKQSRPSSSSKQGEEECATTVSPGPASVNIGGSDSEGVFDEVAFGRSDALNAWFIHDSFWAETDAADEVSALRRESLCRESLTVRIPAPGEPGTEEEPRREEPPPEKPPPEKPPPEKPPPEASLRKGALLLLRRRSSLQRTLNFDGCYECGQPSLEDDFILSK